MSTVSTLKSQRKSKVKDQKKSAVDRKTPKKPKEQKESESEEIEVDYKELSKLLPDEKPRIEDVLSSMNKFLYLRTGFNCYSSCPMFMTEQLKPGGVAADLVIHLDTFKEFVLYLEDVRYLTDTRVRRDFWPLFYQIFMHVPRDELNESIKYFLSVDRLFEKGLRVVDPLKFLWQTYPEFAREFSSAAAFILDPTEMPIDYEYHQKCQKLSFFLLIKFRESLRELTVWAMIKGTPAIDNLIRYFCCYPAFVRHPLKKPENPAVGKEGDPLALRMIRNLVNFELEEVTPEVKAEYLKRIVEGITNPCKILVREEIQPIMDPDSFGDILVQLENRIYGWE